MTLIETEMVGNVKRSRLVNCSVYLIIQGETARNNAGPR